MIASPSQYLTPKFKSDIFPHSGFQWAASSSHSNVVRECVGICVSTCVCVCVCVLVQCAWTFMWVSAWVCVSECVFEPERGAWEQLCVSVCVSVCLCVCVCVSVCVGVCVFRVRVVTKKGEEKRTGSKVGWPLHANWFDRLPLTCGIRPLHSIDIWSLDPPRSSSSDGSFLSPGCVNECSKVSYKDAVEKMVLDV